jgi:hypothetical protein
MELFCKTCPDQGAEDCKLISNRESLTRGAKIVVSTVVESIGSVGYASGPVVMPECDTRLNRLNNQRNTQLEEVKLCIQEHLV